MCNNNGSYSWNGRLLTKAMLEYSHLKFTRTQGSVCEPIIFKKYFLNIMGHLNFHLASTKKKPRSLSEQVIFQVKWKQFIKPSFRESVSHFLHTKFYLNKSPGEKLSWQLCTKQTFRGKTWPRADGKSTTQIYFFASPMSTINKYRQTQINAGYKGRW